MICIQYTYAIPSAIIVSTLFAYERMDLNGTSKKLDRGAEFFKNQQGTAKRGGRENLTEELRFFFSLFTIIVTDTDYEA